MCGRQLGGPGIIGNPISWQKGEVGRLLLMEGALWLIGRRQLSSRLPILRLQNMSCRPQAINQSFSCPKDAGSHWDRKAIEVDPSEGAPLEAESGLQVHLCFLTTSNIVIVSLVIHALVQSGAPMPPNPLSVLWHLWQFCRSSWKRVCAGGHDADAAAPAIPVAGADAGAGVTEPEPVQQSRRPVAVTPPPDEAGDSNAQQFAARVSDGPTVGKGAFQLPPGHLQKHPQQRSQVVDFDSRSSFTYCRAVPSGASQL